MSPRSMQLEIVAAAFQLDLALYVYRADDVAPAGVDPNVASDVLEPDTGIVTGDVHVTREIADFEIAVTGLGLRWRILLVP